MKKILIVTVQYRQVLSTLLMLESISSVKKSGILIDVIVVDNAHYESTEAERSVLQNKTVYPIKIIDNINSGYFMGLNTGIKSTNKLLDYDFLVVCNNDLTFTPDFFENLTSLSSSLFDTHCVVPRIIGPNGEDQNPQYHNPIRFLKRLGIFLLFSLPAWIGFPFYAILYNLLGRSGMSARTKSVDITNSEQPIYLPLGAIFIFTPQLLNEIGLLPEQSFLYGEEMFLREQLVTNNFTFFMSTQLVVHHAESMTTNSLQSHLKWLYQRVAFHKFKWFYLLGK